MDRPDYLRAAPLAACGVALALVTGCGGGGESTSEKSDGLGDDAAREVVQRHLQGVVDGDGATACADLTAEFAEESGGGGSCEDAFDGDTFEAEAARGFEVGAVERDRMDGRAVTTVGATYPNGSSAYFLVAEDGAWKIAGAFSTSTSAK